MINLVARSLGIILICIFLIIEFYSISSAFKDGLQEFSNDGLGTLILGNLLILFFAIVSPLWSIMMPIIIITFGVAMPFNGILMIYESIFKRDSESSFILGLGLCIAAYFYTAKISIPIIKNAYFPKFKEFLDYLLNFIS